MNPNIGISKTYPLEPKAILATNYFLNALALF
nr:MAG TPA: hypothetical protein [Bacteriophage sp.]